MAVNLDGDAPGAQRLGERFAVHGYPTVIVLSPDGEEITRIALGLEMEQYVSALDLALAATQPAAAAYSAVLSGVATESDLRMLAFYSWGQDNDRLVGEQDLIPALRELATQYPAHLRVEGSRIFMHYLAAYAESASTDAPLFPMTDGEADQVRKRMLQILADPALTLANLLNVVYGAHWIYQAIAGFDEAEAASLANGWNAALDRIREDPRTSAADRIGTLYGKICLAMSQRPDSAVPRTLVRAVRRAVRDADLTDADPYDRMDFFASASAALGAAGLDNLTHRFMTEELERTHSPDYVMLALGSLEMHTERTDDALRWMERAWQEARGPATRFERGTNYVLTLLQLTPDDAARIEDATIALFRQTRGQQDLFFQRTTRRVRTLETQLGEWNSDGSRVTSLARIRAEVMAVCDTIPAGDPGRETCLTFLAEQSLNPSV